MNKSQRNAIKYLIRKKNNKYQQDKDTFGSNNEIGYVTGNGVLVVIGVVLLALAVWMIIR